MDYYMFKRIALFFDDLLLGMSKRAQIIAIGYMSVGIIFAMISFILKIHDVQFDGRIVGNTVSGIADGVSKQVGYIWAPNWALTSIILLPLALYNLLTARLASEKLVESLVENNMIITKDGSSVDIEDLNNKWKSTSSIWSCVTFFWIFSVFIFIILGDFVPVVGSWLFTPNFAEIAVENLSINHSEYEFDWSISALFPGESVSNWSNFAFSLSVYLFVPILGAGMMLGGFLWFVSISSFYSSSHMSNEGYVIIPDLKSPDPRRGFEIFEPIFDKIIRAGLITAAMALAMHLQNVYLRTPSHPDILEMLFKDAASVAVSLMKLNAGPMKDYFLSMDEALEIAPHDISLQTYVTALANLLVFCVILGLMWRWLRNLALEGKSYAQRHLDLSKKDKKMLKGMVFWPVGWLSATGLTTLIALSLAAMYFVNLLALLIFFGLLYFASTVLSEILQNFRKGLKPDKGEVDEDE